jgi:uncharacterized protein (DUF849 family)
MKQSHPSSEPAPFVLAVAPSGTRKTKADCSSIPLTAEELGAQALDWVAAGATLLHLHVRDDQGKHSISAARYEQAIKAVRAAVGDDLVIQVAIEQGLPFGLDKQISVIRQLRPETASVAVREFAPKDPVDPKVVDFFRWAWSEGTAIQYILYDTEDVKRFCDLIDRGIIPGHRHLIIFPLGFGGATADEALISRFLEDFGKYAARCTWFTCAFGQNEAELVLAAAAKGGHGRVGYENNTYLPDGRAAATNADLLRAVTDGASAKNLRVATIDETRSLLRQCCRNGDE